jgi:Fic family protein
MNNSEKLKQQLETLLPMKSEDEKRLKKKFRLEFNYNSNHLEGNTLTYGQTQLLLINDKISGDVKVSDVEEMKAHDLALSQIEEFAKDKEYPLTEQFIKELNRIILVKPYWKEAITADGITTSKKIEIGNYKTSPNSVRLRDGNIHEYASPEETPAKMNDLMNWYKENENIMSAPQLAAEFHYRFVCIHPFDDGNGRVARLLMNYILLKNQYPMVIIKSEDKENYLTALQKADLGYIVNIIEYIEKQLIWSLEISIKAAKGEDIEEKADIDKEIELLKREKLTKTKISMSPKVVYELIKYVNNELCYKITESKNKFNDFFAETTFEIFINEVKFKEKSNRNNSFKVLNRKEETVKQYEIFNYDLEEKIIKTIKWRWNFLYLKTTENEINFIILCSLTFNKNSYKIEIEFLNTNNTISRTLSNTIFIEEHEYKSYLMQEEIEKIGKMVSNYLIKEIKEQK